MRLFQEIKNWKTVRGWHIWKLKLVDARLYFVSMVVGLLTGLIAVPYHYLLYYLLHVRSGLFASRPAWYWHIPLFMLFWGILILVSRLVGKTYCIKFENRYEHETYKYTRNHFNSTGKNSSACISKTLHTHSADI